MQITVEELSVIHQNTPLTFKKQCYIVHKTMDLLSIIHINSDSPPFELSTWIGANRLYHNVPDEVSMAKNECLHISQFFLCRILVPTLSVMDIIGFKIPTLSSSMIMMKTSVWFSKDQPTTEPECMWKCTIVPESFLHCLECDFGQAWLDGAQSIVDPRFNEGRDRLPLWMLGFWRKMVGIIQDQDQWK